MFSAVPPLSPTASDDEDVSSLSSLAGSNVVQKLPSFLDSTTSIQSGRESSLADLHRLGSLLRLLSSCHSLSLSLLSGELNKALVLIVVVFFKETVAAAADAAETFCDQPLPCATGRRKEVCNGKVQACIKQDDRKSAQQRKVNSKTIGDILVPTPILINKLSSSKELQSWTEVNWTGLARLRIFLLPRLIAFLLDLIQVNKDKCQK
mmetsp:Transcript_6722/g.8699  ORF Transcript_6722/g.8699 Transcript_6722/m.8699 type:complete len:207 (-) Transcript_6722:168-788(-)